MPRFVIDTCVVVEGIKDHSSPSGRVLMDVLTGKHIPVATAETLFEYRRILGVQFSGKPVEEKVLDFLSKIQLLDVESYESLPYLTADPNDQHLIIAAFVSRCDIISLDHHLLDIANLARIMLGIGISKP